MAAERFVARHLESLGYVVCARNWSAAGGELDLVVSRGADLRFVEVKARQPGDSSGLEAIDRRKQRKLIRAANAWLLEHGTPSGDLAFMVAIVQLDPDGWTLELLDDAFDG